MKIRVTESGWRVSHKISTSDDNSNLCSASTRGYESCILVDVSFEKMEFNVKSHPSTGHIPLLVRKSDDIFIR